MALFPDAPVYILGGLESVGSIPAPNTLTPEAVAEGLDNLRKSAEVILSFGHFITKDMKAELDRTAFRGVLPLIYTFIALTGGEIVSTRYVGVGGDGVLRESGESLSGSRGVLPGVQIEFRREGGAGVQTLYYVQANVADDALKSNGALSEMGGRFRRRQRLSQGSFLPASRTLFLAHSFLPSQSSCLGSPGRFGDSVPVLARTAAGAAGSLAPTPERWTYSRSIIKAIFRRPLPRQAPLCPCHLEPATSGDWVNPTCFWPSSSGRRDRARPAEQ